LPRAGIEPETEFRPGRLLLAGLLACIGPLAWIMLLPVVDEDEDEVPQDAPMTLAAAATPDTGRDRPQRTPLAELSPLSETGASCACANAGAATPAVRMAAEAAPPSKIRQLYMTRLVKLTVKLKAGHSAGIRRLRAGRRDRSAPDTVTQL
jgi:hypothetical protein